MPPCHSDQGSFWNETPSGIFELDQFDNGRMLTRRTQTYPCESLAWDCR